MPPRRSPASPKRPRKKAPFEPPRQKQLRGEATAIRALGAALAVYELGGHERFTIQAIAKTSGISVGSLYHHFGSIDGLAAALYASCMYHLMSSLAEAVETSKTARSGVLALTRAYLAFTVERPAEARFIHASSYASFLPAHASVIEDAKSQALLRLHTWLATQVRAGEIRDIPPALFEMIVIGPVAETARRWLGGARDIDPKEASRVLPDLIWRSVAKA